MLLLLSDPDTNNSPNDDTSAFILGITYVESVSDSTIQVDLMIMCIHPMTPFLLDLPVGGITTDTISIVTSITLMVICYIQAVRV